MQVKLPIRKTFYINDDVRKVIVNSLKYTLLELSRLGYSSPSAVFEALAYKMTPENHDSVRVVIHSAMARLNPESFFGPADTEFLTALKEEWDTKPFAYVWPVLLNEAMQAAVAEGLPLADDKRKNLGDWLWDSFR